MKFGGAMTPLASIILLSTTAFASVIRRADPATTDPYDDPFYAQPANIATYQPGAVIDSRTIQTNYSSAVQLKYRTTDGQGNAVSTLATLWSPAFPNANNPPRILSYQYAEDAINLDCAPSWALVKGSRSQNSNISAIEAPLVVPPSLFKNYYVVQPDAEGPNSTWLVGNQEGKATLDAIRAVINYKSLAKNTRIGLYGYSGAAHSTVWAAELAASYASELNIVGAAFGGTPIDLQSVYELLNGKPSALLAGGALFGLAQGYPALEADLQNGADGLTQAGKDLARTFRTRNFCFNGRLADYANRTFEQYFKNKNPLANPTLQAVLRRESLLNNVSSIGVPVPKFPRFQYHGTADTIVPYGPEAAYIQQQCAAGANIQFLSIPGADHAPAAVAGLEPALNFLDQAFNNATPKCTCGTLCA